MRKIFKNILMSLYMNKIDPSKIEIVKEFFQNYEGFRTIPECSLKTGVNINECKVIKNYLYRNNILGGYTFEKGQPPHKYMKNKILELFPHVNEQTQILEIGPGKFPIFDLNVYKNWYGIDKNFDADGIIKFSGRRWDNDNKSRIFNGCWEDISSVTDTIGKTGTFDLIVASHSYEHVIRPIHSLKEAAKALKPDGVLVLFVPNGYSDDLASRLEMTHTLYLVPEMIREFFNYSDCFTDIIIKDFRPNYDYIISAKAKKLLEK